MISVGDKEYYLNNLLEEDSLENMSALIAENPSLGISTPTEFFPLKFVTQINLDPFIDWEGVFDFI